MASDEKKQREVNTEAVFAALVKLRRIRQSPRYRSFLSADAIEVFSALNVSGYAGPSSSRTIVEDCISLVQTRR
ncbi:hypothetical protein [Pseudomonas sp. DSP3-2-2]|uniref:hypothetical protein n=1 Tax=unclassified Pseudomonas TaxID=196821 RepID=UPI003CF98A75